MTKSRAALIAVLDAYRIDPAVRMTLLVCQKLAYLLQTKGEPLRLDFVKGHYGPYSEAINHVLERMDGHFLRGYGDRTAEADIQVDTDAAHEAVRFLDDAPETRSRIADVQTLIDGFESPWGLELLTTVHWAAHQGGATTADDAAAFVAQWNARKQMVFDSRHVEAAWHQLAAYDWLPEIDRETTPA
jgi:hypothetical protein